jgi:hypothetical protein
MHRILPAGGRRSPQLQPVKSQKHFHALLFNQHAQQQLRQYTHQILRKNHGNHLQTKLAIQNLKRLSNLHTESTTKNAPYFPRSAQQGPLSVFKDCIIYQRSIFPQIVETLLHHRITVHVMRLVTPQRPNSKISARVVSFLKEQINFSIHAKPNISDVSKRLPR